LDKRGLQDLVKEVDPTEQLDEDVEDLLLQVADDFIENIINSSCQLAKHRKSNILEVKDVQFHLGLNILHFICLIKFFILIFKNIERNFNLWIPGFSTDDLKPFKKSFATEAHKQRLQLIKKSAENPKEHAKKSSKD
jgi:transcription initiation factor TFIID subunit 12